MTLDEAIEIVRQAEQRPEPGSTFTEAAAAWMLARAYLKERDEAAPQPQGEGANAMTPQERDAPILRIEDGPTYVIKTCQQCGCSFVGASVMLQERCLMCVQGTKDVQADAIRTAVNDALERAANLCQDRCEEHPFVIADLIRALKEPTP